MQALKRGQRDKVRQLIGFTGVEEHLAIELLRMTDWSLEAAADAFFTGGGASADPDVDEEKIAALFDKYKEADDSDTIQISGVEQFCKDLGVDPTDPIMLLIPGRCAARRCASSRGRNGAGASRRWGATRSRRCARAFRR